MSLSRSQLPQTFQTTKSTVLAGAGVQDAYWSDEEDEDAECPLCMEEMDVAEMGFRPCPCGYQICMFCYHHIKNNLNGRCPACRREYLEENVEFTAVAKEDLMRQNQQKKRKERERKELEALGRRHFANVRVVQRNVVYVVGLGPRLAKEEAISLLRSTEYFGQYGKISKIILAKRHQPGSKQPVVGLYITYHRREDATRAINAVDGTHSPGGGTEVMRASYGTTKYCMSFLRGSSCSNTGCLDLHEWGDKNDCFTKEDLTTLKHSLKDSENQTKAVVKKLEHQDSLPRTTSWAQKQAAGSTFQTSTSRPPRPAPGRTRNQSSSRNTVAAADGQTRSTITRTHERRTTVQPSTSTPPATLPPKPPSKPISRPATPSQPPALAVRPTSPALPAVVRTRALETVPPRSGTPTSTVTVDSDVGSSNIDGEVPMSPAPVQAVPSAPPGLPPPSSSYQISTQAQALLDDVRARRDAPQLPVASPFPEFDRTLDSLGGGDFQWSLDPKFAARATTAPNTVYQGAFDPFAGQPSKPAAEQPPRQFTTLVGPPGLSSPYRPPASPSQNPAGYQGPFNPFGDSDDHSANHSAADLSDGSRQESRFGFARRRASPSVAGSPSLSSLISPVSSNGAQMQYAMDNWSFARPQQAPPAAYAQQMYMAVQQHTPQSEYAQRSSLSLQTSFSAVHNGQFRGQQHQAPAFPPGLRFHPFDGMEAERSNLEQQYRADPASDPASQASTSMERTVPTEVAAASQPPVTNVFGGPPGLSPRGSTPSSMFSPVYSEQLQRQPTPIRISLSSSQHGSSMASTPAHASPHPSPVSFSAKPTPQAETVLLASEFPALPASSSESQPKREQNQPYIQPTVKVPEPKLASQSAPTTKKSAKSSKETKPAPEPISKAPESPVKSSKPVELLPAPTPTPTATASKAKSRKQEKREKEELAKAASATVQDAKKKEKLAPKPAPPPPPSEPEQEPLFSKVSKKARPSQPKVKPPKETKEDHTSTKAMASEPLNESALTASSPSIAQKQTVSEVSQTDAPVQPVAVNERSSLLDLLDQLSRKGLDLTSYSLFDPETVEGDGQTPLQYGPLVHALSALSVGGGSFANNLPAVSIDSAVSSFQQLLETLTQTISDLLRLLPRATWDDSSSFDGVLRDMLKGDDFLDDNGEEGGREDEVAALTLALERRARWMEVQLAKLEELHRDINTAAVRAVLTFNDRGWDPSGFMPRAGQSLAQFETVGMVQGKGKTTHRMTIEELQKAMEKAKSEETSARQAVLESMGMLRDLLPVGE